MCKKFLETIGSILPQNQIIFPLDLTQIIDIDFEWLHVGIVLSISKQILDPVATAMFLSM